MNWDSDFDDIPVTVLSSAMEKDEKMTDIASQQHSTEDDTTTNDSPDTPEPVSDDDTTHMNLLPYDSTPTPPPVSPHKGIASPRRSPRLSPKRPPRISLLDSIPMTSTSTYVAGNPSSPSRRRNRKRTLCQSQTHLDSPVHFSKRQRINPSKDTSETRSMWRAGMDTSGSSDSELSISNSNVLTSAFQSPSIRIIPFFDFPDSSRNVQDDCPSQEAKDPSSQDVLKLPKLKLNGNDAKKEEKKQAKKPPLSGVETPSKRKRVKKKISASKSKTKAKAASTTPIGEKNKSDTDYKYDYHSVFGFSFKAEDALKHPKPMRSSIKRPRTKTRYRDRSRSAMKHSSSLKSVRWESVNVYQFEQRAGMLSCAVPDEGTSLHLGNFIGSENAKIDEYEKLRESERKPAANYDVLNARERHKRVKAFSPKDVASRKLREEKKELDVIRNSRNENCGCSCRPAKHWHKQNIYDRLKELGVKEEELNGVSKKDLQLRLEAMYLDTYGDKDACCVDPKACECLRNGIACHIEGRYYCACGNTRTFHCSNEHGNNLKKDMKLRQKSECHSDDSMNPNEILSDQVNRMSVLEDWKAFYSSETEEAESEKRTLDFDAEEG